MISDSVVSLIPSGPLSPRRRRPSCRICACLQIKDKGEAEVHKSLFQIMSLLLPLRRLASGGDFTAKDVSARVCATARLASRPLCSGNVRSLGRRFSLLTDGWSACPLPCPLQQVPDLDALRAARSGGRRGAGGGGGGMGSDDEEEVKVEGARGGGGDAKPVVAAVRAASCFVCCALPFCSTCVSAAALVIATMLPASP